MQQAGTDNLARVSGHNRASAIFVPKEVVAASDPKNGEAPFPKRGNQVGAGDAGNPAHAAMVTR